MRIAYCVITFLFICFVSNSQETEKVYLHTDKDIYKPGETIWFKAYINDEHNRLSLNSDLLFVTLSSSDSVLFEGLFSTFKGMADGAIDVPSNIEDRSTIMLTAYTDYMKTSNSLEGIFTKTISIFKLPNSVLHAEFIMDSLYSDVPRAMILVKNYAGIPMRNHQLNWNIQDINGKKRKGKTKTNNHGFLTIEINLDKEKPDQSLSVKSEYLGKSYDFNWNIPARQDLIQLHFFPEGGNLLYGIQSRIAFKAVNPKGKGIEIDGVLIDQDGNELQKISTVQAGMGEFIFTPEPDKPVFFKLIKPASATGIFELPKPLQSGLSLHIMEKDNKGILVHIKRNGNSQQIENIELLSSFEGSYSFKQQVQSNDTTAIIPIDELPTGVMRITLLSDGTPKAERIVFIKQDQHFKIRFLSFQDTILTKLKSKIRIKVANQNGIATSGVFSISIVDQTRLYDYISYVEYLYLMNHCKGYIDGLDVALSNSPVAEKVMDLIMLTNGWRTFVDAKEQLVNTSKRSFISGKITSLRGNPVSDAEVTLLNTNTWQALNFKTKEDGVFNVEAKNFLSIANTKPITISANVPNKTKKLKIWLDPIFIDSLQYTDQLLPIKADHLYSFMKPEYMEFMESKGLSILDDKELIDEVVVEGQTKSKVAKEEKEKMFLTTEMTAADIETRTTSSGGKVIEEIISSLIVNRQAIGDGRIVTRGYDSFHPELETGLMIIVDGISFGDDVSNVYWLNAKDIKSAKYISSPGAGLKYGALNSQNGILEITLKDPISELDRINSINEIENLGLNTIPGLVAERKFNNLPEPPKDNIPDLRTTLYWNPNLVISSSGTTTIEFQAGSISGEFIAIINGYSDSNLPGSYSFPFIIQ